MPMATSQPASSYASERPLVSGHHQVVYSMDDYLQEFDELFHWALQDALDRATQELRRVARETPQWDALADHLVVSYSDGRIVYGVNDPAYVEAMNDLEFGGFFRRPSGFLRKFARKSSRVINDLVLETLLEEVPVE